MFVLVLATAAKFLQIQWVQTQKQDLSEYQLTDYHLSLALHVKENTNVWTEIIIGWKSSGGVIGHVCFHG